MRQMRIPRRVSHEGALPFPLTSHKSFAKWTKSSHATEGRMRGFMHIPYTNGLSSLIRAPGSYTLKAGAWDER